MNQNMNENEMIKIIKTGITETMIEEIINGTCEPTDDMVSAFLATIFDVPEAVQLIKAIGITQFQDDHEKCLIINDFCGYLSDLVNQGHESLQAAH